MNHNTGKIKLVGVVRESLRGKQKLPWRFSQTRTFAKNVDRVFQMDALPLRCNYVRGRSFDERAKWRPCQRMITLG